mgnify:CR=1 FL=1
MSVPLRVHATTHMGLVHPINEDSWSVSPTEEGGLLLMVCDGMGGQGRGDEASSLSVRLIRENLESGTGLPPDRMRQALREADRVVREKLCIFEGQRHPGSTAVLAYVIDGAVHVAWVGDSRAYLIRDHRVVDRTRDHKLVEELVRAGQLTPEEAKRSELAHVITRSLGGRTPEEPSVKADTLGRPWKLAHGDTIVLCSDGLYDLVDDDELPSLIADLPPDRATEKLIEVSLERGGHDNITVVVAHWEGATYREDDVATPVMRSERQHLPDLRVAEADLDRPEDPRVTEEIERDELERLVGATPQGAPQAEAPAPAATAAAIDDTPATAVDREKPAEVPRRPAEVSSLAPYAEQEKRAKASRAPAWVFAALIALIWVIAALLLAIVFIII